MKYVVVILAGAADEPVEALDDRTPLAEARAPNLERLAAAGRVGCAWTVPDDFAPSPEIGVMTILGYDPTEHACGRAGLEAAGAGLELQPGESVWRLSLARADEDGVLLEPAARSLTEREARALGTDLVSHWAATCGDAGAGLRLGSTSGGRLLLVDGAARPTVTNPPGAFVGERYTDHLPSGPGGSRLRKLIESGREFLRTHEINQAREEQGLLPANLAWPWGLGEKPRLESFQQRFGQRGVVFCADEAVAGLALCAGMERRPLFLGSEGDPLGLSALAEAVSDALRRTDVVCCYIEETLEPSFRGDWLRKVTVLEEVDRALIGPLMADLAAQYGDPAVEPEAEGWRLLVIADCVASSAERRIISGPVPFVMGGAWVRSAVQRRFTEEDAGASDLRVQPGHDLMEYFLRGGLAAVRAR